MYTLLQKEWLCRKDTIIIIINKNNSPSLSASLNQNHREN